MELSRFLCPLNHDEYSTRIQSGPLCDGFHQFPKNLVNLAILKIHYLSLFFGANVKSYDRLQSPAELRFVTLDDIRPILKASLYGKHAHIDLMKALREITPEIARRRLEGLRRSCWELLYHMRYWQDIIIRAYGGDNSANDANDRDSWPGSGQMVDDSEWSALVDAFESGLEHFTELAEKEDLMKACPVWPQNHLIKDILVEICHNSYHLGQIVQILRGLQSQ